MQPNFSINIPNISDDEMQKSMALAKQMFASIGIPENATNEVINNIMHGFQTGNIDIYQMAADLKNKIPEEELSQIKTNLSQTMEPETLKYMLNCNKYLQEYEKHNSEGKRLVILEHKAYSNKFQGPDLKDISSILNIPLKTTFETNELKFEHEHLDKYTEILVDAGYTVILVNSEGTQIKRPKKYTTISESFECPICTDVKSTVAILKCAHKLCEECVTNITVNNEPYCPFCESEVISSVNI